MPIDNIKMYKTLKDRLGEQETEEFLQYLDEKIKMDVATKDDIRRLEGKIELIRRELGGDLSTLKTELNGKLANLKTELEGKLANWKTDLEGKLTNLRTEFSGNLTNLKTELSGAISQLSEKLERTVATKVDVAKLEGRFQLYFAALAVLVVLTNPKVVDLFGKLLGLVK